MKDEFDTTPLIQKIWAANKKCYLPTLAEGKTLNFVLYNNGDKLQANQYSILEPENSARKICPTKLDLVILPLIAFDQHGKRLGTGGGFFDRTFAYVYEPGEKKQHLIGLAFAAQQAESLIADPWDVAIEGVLTENGFISLPVPSRSP